MDENEQQPEPVAPPVPAPKPVVPKPAQPTPEQRVVTLEKQVADLYAKCRKKIAFFDRL